VTIPDSVSSIGDGAFYGCTSLTYVLFMGIPPELGEYVFNGVYATVYYLNGTPGWTDTFGERPAAPFPFDFTLANGQITIDAYTGSGTASVQIPAAIAGYPVTAIGDAAFYGQTDMTAVHIPDSVASIGFAAFAGCTGLQTVVLGSSVAVVGNWAFYGCTSLASVYARGNAPVLGTSVFTSAPATVYHLPGTAGWGDTFGGCPAVLLPYAYSTTVRINAFPGESATIRIDAYLGDSATVEIPATIEGLSVTAIGDSAFENCTSLVSVTIPDSVRSIGDAAFFNCPLLADVTLHSSYLEFIGDWAFAGCESLALIILPNIQHIGDYAFAFCPALSEVYLDSYAVPTVGTGAFDWTAATIYYRANRDGWEATFAGRPTSPMLYSFRFIDGNATITGYFGSDTNAIAIPSTIAGRPVTTIGHGAFYGCISLTAVTIPHSVTSIGDSAFQFCFSLSSVTIPGSVTSIGEDAFVNCDALTSVYIPDSVTSIGDCAFSYCHGLTAINVDSGSPAYASVDGILYNKSHTMLIQCPGGKTGSYTIPECVTTIGSYAFSSCTALTSITIPDSVTSIGYSAFEYCTALTSVFFKGNEPCREEYDVFFEAANVTIYYLPDSTGWSTTFSGRPALLWNPVVQNDSAFGFAPDGFGFNISGTANIPVVVEACTNLSCAVWVPVTNATLDTYGELYFTDPSSASHPARFYRIVGP